MRRQPSYGAVLALAVAGAGAHGQTHAAQEPDERSAAPAPVSAAVSPLYQPEAPARDPAPVLRVRTDTPHARILFLSWDTEGGDRASRNLLRAPAFLRWKATGQTRSTSDLPRPSDSASENPTTRDNAPENRTNYRIALRPGAELVWTIEQLERGLSMKLSAGESSIDIEQFEMVFPFDPGLTPTTVLPAEQDESGRLHLPAIISAPDFGQMLLSSTSGRSITARVEGSRAQKTVDIIIEIPVAELRHSPTFDFRPVYLPPPPGLQDLSLWRAVRGGWFNVFQATAKWGDQNNPFSSPPGLLGNNVLSDPASTALSFYADQAFWTPELAPGISAARMVRRTVDFWLDQRTRPTGEVIGYWAYGDFLDANSGPLIAAWDYVEATGDRDWLARRIERLEFIAEFLARRDVDGDGMIEATQSGNRGTLQQPKRSCCWWDALNCGYKDGYSNAFIYRAFRCLADLERKASRPEKAARYAQLADRLKAAYFNTLYNPKTGWLAWWKSQDGELHDYATPVVNGLAVEYGLVDPSRGKEILARLRGRMKAVGFMRFDLGLPGTLVPVARADYLLPDALGCPKKEDGSDTFGQYMNGGISAGQGTPFIVAHYLVGESSEGDRMLRAMLTRQARGGFQNGVRDAGMQGIDWTTWDGRPCGYEGYLSDSFRFVQAVLLRERALRERFYRPLTPAVAP